MESLKPILLLIVLGGVAYGVYVALNHAPPAEPLPNVGSSWNSPVGADRSAGPQTAVNRADAVSPNANGSGAAWDGRTPGGAIDNGNSWNTPAITPGPNSTPNSASPSADASASANGTTQNSSPGMSALGSLPFAVKAAANTPPAAMTPTTPSTPPSITGADASASQPTITPSSQQSLPPLTATPETDQQAQARHDYEAAMRGAQFDLSQGKLVDALRELSKWYDNAVVPAEDQERFVDLLGQLAGTVVYSRKSYLGPPYVVRAGDSLESIARECQVPWQLLAKINGLSSPNGLIPGQELKVMRGPFQAQLNANKQWLALFVDGLYAGRFHVQMDGPVNKPDGTYPVVKFDANSTGASGTLGAPYISLGGDLHLRMSTDAVPPGLPAVRMSAQDMGDVFDILSERSEVTIRR